MRGGRLCRFSGQEMVIIDQDSGFSIRNGFLALSRVWRNKNATGVRLNDKKSGNTRMNKDLENRADMNTDKKWSQMDLLDLANCIRLNDPRVSCQGGVSYVG
jgi:hypothetical protein